MLFVQAQIKGIIIIMANLECLSFTLTLTLVVPTCPLPLWTRDQRRALRAARDKRYRDRVAQRKEDARAAARLAAVPHIRKGLEHAARARLCMKFPLTFEQRRFTGRCGCGAERWTSMELEAGGRLVVVELDTLAHAGCGGVAGGGAAGGRYGGLAEGRRAGLLESEWEPRGGACTVLRVNLGAAGAADAEQVLERLAEAERVLERLAEAGGGHSGAPAGGGPAGAPAGAEVEVVEVGFAGAAEGPQDAQNFEMHV